MKWALVALVGVCVGCGDDAADGSSSSSGGQGGAGADGGAGGTGNTGNTGNTGGTGNTGNTGGTGNAAGDGGAGGIVDPCGNGVIDGAEVCDGAELQGAACNLMGYTGGVVSCLSDCSDYDTTGCFALEVCNNGIDDNLDGLYDCADPGCNNAVVCTTGQEAICTDIQNNDGDPEIDCEDATLCQTLPICASGAGAVGDACVAPNDCAANMDDPICFSEAETGFPDGYCAEFCDSANDDCPVGSVCTGTTPAGNGVCFLSCTTDADCRPLYTCGNVGGEDVCLPGPVEICDNTMDENHDGLIDCADPQCASFAGCDEIVCDDIADNDSDGFLDCNDPTCQPLAECVPGAGATGAPCTANTDCSANANDPFCFVPGLLGMVDGYCSQFCDLASDDCPAGSLCYDFGFASGDGLCIDECLTDADCRESYECAPDGPNAELLCVPSGNVEICNNTTDDDNDGDVDCDDSDCLLDPACPEANCVNFQDDDGDTDVDCNDSDCQSLAACVPGAGAAGAPCTKSNDCAADMNDPICIYDALGFPDGYCAEWCDPAVAMCGTGGVCVTSGNSGICAHGCTDNNDCRAGYECISSPNGSVCVPL